MSKRSNVSKIQAQIHAQKLKIAELEDEYAVQLYFETMPAYDPLYKYCYQTSNMTIPGYMQCIDHWLNAVIKHMGMRHRGHGGEGTKAVVVSVPKTTTQENKDAWLNYVNKKLSKKVRIKN